MLFQKRTNRGWGRAWESGPGPRRPARASPGFHENEREVRKWISGQVGCLRPARLFFFASTVSAHFFWFARPGGPAGGGCMAASRAEPASPPRLELLYVCGPTKSNMKPAGPSKTPFRVGWPIELRETKQNKLVKPQTQATLKHRWGLLRRYANVQNGLRAATLYACMILFRTLFRLSGWSS